MTGKEFVTGKEYVTSQEYVASEKDVTSKEYVTSEKQIALLSRLGEHDTRYRRIIGGRGLVVEVD